MKGRPVRKFAYGGQEYSLYGLSVKFGIKLSTLESRVYGRKMTIKDAIAMGPADAHRERGALYEYHGEQLTLKEISRRCGRCYDMLRRKIKEGMTAEEAAFDLASSAEIRARRRIAQSDAYHEHVDGLDAREKTRYDAAVKICREIAFSSPFEFDFRCTVPRKEYVFESDLLKYKISFLGNVGTLTAEYREHSLPSDLNRRYLVTQERIKEIR